MQPGILEYTSISAFQGYDYVEYEICDNDGMCAQGVWTILVYDYTTECELIFIEEEVEIEIENCQSAAHFCLPYNYEQAESFEVYVDGALQNDLPICNQTSYRAYDFLSSELGECAEEIRFPLSIESWVIEGEEFSSGQLNDWGDIEYFMNTIDPCGFWFHDGNGQLRGGMIILNYEELVFSSSCGAVDILSWESYTIPENFKVLLPASSCYEVVVKNISYENCADTIEVCVPCLGIINTEPFTVDEQNIEEDEFFTTTYSGSMMNYCLTFDDIQNHQVGISSISESSINPDVFYEPGGYCFCYQSPLGFIGQDIVTVEFCDSGDPVLCNEATVIIDVIENDGSNSAPFTNDIFNAPEDTLFAYVQLNEFSEICLDFGDAENNNVGINDIIDLYEGSSVTWNEGEECFTYIPPPNEVGADVLMVNYCDDGFPELCGATWIVIEILPSLPINSPPVLIENEAVVNSIETNAEGGVSSAICLEFADLEEDFVGLSEVISSSGAYINFIPGANCFSYTANSGFSGTDEVTIIFCDEGSPLGLCNQATVIINVTPGAVCPEYFAEDDYYLETSDCLNPLTVSIPLSHSSLDNYLIVANGEEIEDISSFGISNLIVYDFSEIAENDCFINGDMDIQMQSWMFNGSTNNIFGQVLSLEEIVNVLNQEDNIGFWSLDIETNQVYSEANLNNYQILQVLVACDGDSFETMNFFPSQSESFAGVEFTLAPGECYDLNILNTISTCFDAATFCLSCVQNTPPLAIDENGFQVFSFSENINEEESTLICLDLIDNDEGDIVNITSVSSQTFGAVSSIEEEDCIAYTPPSNFTGMDVLTVQFCDDAEEFLCSEITIQITVEDVNDIPVAVDDHFFITTTQELTGDLLNNDYDPEDDPFFFFQMDSQPLGNAVINNGMLTYLAPSDFCGQDGFLYSICDGLGNCSQAEVFIQVNPLDSDGDNIPDFIEGTGDFDMDGLANYLDSDSDNDQIPDLVEAYAQGVIEDLCEASPIDSDNDGVQDYLDSDSDDDNISDLIEGFYDCDEDGIPNYLDVSDNCEYSELLNPDINIPEGFSPNYNGENDLFVLEGIELFPETKLSVYNRYGSLVYESAPYNNDWNGNSSISGMPLPSSTYYYILEFGGDINPINGYVYILND